VNLYSKALQTYLEEHTQELPQVMQDLHRRTYVEMLMPQMISGKVQGNFLSMIAKMINAQQILEIGTFTGFSSICFANAIGPNGKVHTIEMNQEYLEMAEDFWDKAGVRDKIDLHIGQAEKIIPQLDHQFDLVFIDGGKRHYPEFYDLVFSKIKVGGIILADNVLWSGQVLNEKKDILARALDQFNKTVNEDPRVENVILPLRDGVHMIRKVSD